MMKRLKLTNRNQMRILIDEMKANVDIARNTSSKTPEEITAFWCNLQLQLNKEGPPLRQLTGWKKVWSDYKHKLKKKVKNLTSDFDDGCKTVVLSGMEREAIQLLNIETTYNPEVDNAVAEDSSGEDVYSLDNFDNRGENSTELAAKAVKLYDLQIELLKKELNNWENLDKINNDVDGSSPLSSMPSSPDVNESLIKFEDFDAISPPTSACIDQKFQADNIGQEMQQSKKRKLNAESFSPEENIVIKRDTNFPDRIKTEIINESEIDFENYERTRTAGPSNKGIFIIDTVESPLPPLAPAPPPTPPQVTADLTSNLKKQPPALKPAPHLNKRKMDASTNTELFENGIQSHESVLINISNTLQEIRETNDHFVRYLEKICATEDKKLALMQDANNEQKRHNLQMEKFARISL